MPPDNYFTVVVQSITELLTRHSDMFVAMGGNLFRGFAIILISWFGAKVALSASNEHQAFHFGNFASLLLTISFGFAMITYYDSPIPGFGISFKNLILDQSFYLARQIEVSTIEEIQQRLTEVYLTMERPTLLRGVYIVHYFLILVAIILAQMAVFAVIAFGYVAMAVIVLVGPIFIPFFIVPHMEWMFWGWLRAFIQYSFYQVVANAFVFVFAQLLLHFLDLYPPPFDSATISILFVQLVFLLLSFVYGVLKIPSLVNSIFSGRSGESALPRAIG